MKKLPIHHEEHLQLAIASFLDDLVKLNKLLWCHVPNESQTKASIGWHQKRKKMGLKAGFPDLIIIGKEKTLFIELKYNPNIEKEIDGLRLLSTDQIKWKNDLERFNQSYYIICAKYTHEAVKKLHIILEDEGIL
uniref:Putative VRR-NUC domain-containing protein n=1 Tax=viral metagenome TaxID=1070528 RepID=A0A6M3LQJ3_9ZZZZ